MTKREPDDLEGVDPELEDLTASLLDRWQALKNAPAPDPDSDSDSDSGTVSRLDEARARRDGPAPVEPPLAEPIQLPVRAPSPEPDATPPDEGVRRPKHAALRTFPPTERATDSVTASREVMDALGTGPAGDDARDDADDDTGDTGDAGPGATGPQKPRSAGSRRAPRHAAEPKPPRLPKPSWRKPTAPWSPWSPESSEGPTPEATSTTPSPAPPTYEAAPATPDAPTTPWHPPSRPVAPHPSPPVPAASNTGRRGSAEPETTRSLNVEFAPKLAARRVVGLLLLVLVAATVAAGVVAYTDARPLTLGTAGTLLALTLVVYAIRAGSAPTHLAIRSGQLEVVRGKTMEKFDLTSRFTRIEVVGTPGRPGWKVLLGRFGRDPLVISGSIVDPKRFMTELERYRPKE